MTELHYGEQAPWFQAPELDGNPTYAMDSAAGRPILLGLCGSAGQPACAAALRSVQRHRDLFDDTNACFFGVSIDPADVSEKRIARQLPGIRWFLDHQFRVSKLYGAAIDNPDGGVRYQPCFLLLDHRLRVVARFGLQDAEAAIAATRDLARSGCETQTAPVLVVPRVFEPEVCRHLIGLYEAQGGTDSGFMRERDGMTVKVIDHSFKRRADHVIEDDGLRNALRLRLISRLLPEIRRAFQYEVTHIERWLVARYDGETGGYFSPHRDNTTRGTAHRRFACTINLNSEDYRGGDLCFPEFGPRTYRAPTGGAVIFSCSLLHQALPVTSGRRYAFLPFLYDAQAQVQREANEKYIVDPAATVAAPTLAEGRA